MNHKKSKFTLEEVKQKFEQWRSSKTNKRGRIPDEFWNLSVNLYPTYSMNQIATTLNLSHKKLKSKIHLEQKAKLPTAPEFIEITTPQEQLKSVKNISFTRFDGAQMSLEFEKDPNLDSLISAFLNGAL